MPRWTRRSGPSGRSGGHPHPNVSLQSTSARCCGGIAVEWLESAQTSRLVSRLDGWPLAASLWRWTTPNRSCPRPPPHSCVRCSSRLLGGAGDPARAAGGRAHVAAPARVGLVRVDHRHRVARALGPGRLVLRGADVALLGLAAALAARRRAAEAREACEAPCGLACRSSCQREIQGKHCGFRLSICYREQAGEPHIEPIVPTELGRSAGIDNVAMR